MIAAPPTYGAATESAPYAFVAEMGPMIRPSAAADWPIPSVPPWS